MATIPLNPSLPERAPVAGFGAHLNLPQTYYILITSAETPFSNILSFQVDVNFVGTRFNPGQEDTTLMSIL